MTPARRDGLMLAAILATAAGLRLVGIIDRGEWDDDQGAQLLTMLDWVRHGELPLLGPVASSGTVHHGVAYYWVLAPGAFVTDAHPLAAIVTLAMLGVAGVAATWWLGRIVGGPLCGHLAGLLMAVSPVAIETSTFVWNSNIVAPAAAVAVAAGWQAWRTRRPAWWLLSAAATVFMVHGHLLAVLGVVPLAVLLGLDVLRRHGADRRRALRYALGWAALLVAGAAPVLSHELRSGFAQTRAIVDHLGTAAAADRLTAVPVIAWRVLAAPLSGSVGTAPLVDALAVFSVVAAFVVVLAGASIPFGRWAAAGTGWAIAALALTAHGLVTVHPGLPNAQYHSWLDPVLFVVVGAAATWLWHSRLRSARWAAAVLTVGGVVLAVLSMPSVSGATAGPPRRRPPTGSRRRRARVPSRSPASTNPVPPSASRCSGDPYRWWIRPTPSSWSSPATRCSNKRSGCAAVDRPNGPAPNWPDSPAPTWRTASAPGPDAPSACSPAREAPGGERNCQSTIAPQIRA